MRLSAGCAACLLFAGCAQSSGVLKMGLDTYTISAAAAPARGGSSEARKIALAEANQHCAQMGREILVTNIGTATTNLYGAGSAEVTFRCVARPGRTATTGVDGTYTGDINGRSRDERFGMRVTFTLVQSGNQIAGTWNTTAGASGTVTGTLRDGAITDLRARQVNPCPGHFTGAAVAESSNTVLRGQYAGSDCSGAVTASFEAVRQ
jgi:hypothetical protein